MIDGATDTGNLENEIVYVKFFNKERGVVQSFLTDSALRELRMLADAMEEKVLKPTNLKGARWLPYIHKATQILCNSYAIFVAHSEDQVSPERSAQRGHPDLHLK
ncbi:hypothetical protein NQZ68_031207 [Dissostichus eleginoides]|nr:hypothetical protein NQZ68_031207 [Dissostichus eleginoides]